MSITLSKIKKKQVTVGVIGLGYVGLPLSLAFAEAGINVVGFDIDHEKIEALKKGKSYIRYIPGKQIKAVSKSFSVTDNFIRVNECDAVIICVPTPLTTHLEPDLGFIRQTCETIAPHIKPHTLVVLESTTYPGTTDEVVRPLLETKGSCKVGVDLYLAFSPEREDPGNPNYGTKTIPKLVGGANAESLELAAALYATAVQEIVPLRSTQVAEAAKILENVFRSVNIAMVNELKIIFDRMGIDVWEVIEAAGTKPFGYMPFFPGPGLGGHCIPIDPFYLTWKAKEYGISTRFIELAGEINRAMPQFVIGKVQDCLNDFGKPVKGAKILILGLTYKPGVADIRESPSLELMTLLEAKGAKVDFTDPLVEEIPSTRQYGPLMGRKSVDPTSKYDCFILSTAHKQFDVDDLVKLKVPVVDTRHHFPNHDLVFRA